MSFGKEDETTVEDLSATCPSAASARTAEPWAYGASVLALNPRSQAPSHPTPQGQQAISQVVLKALPSNPKG